MTTTDRHPHDTASAVHFTMAALRRVLQAAGVFDGEIGDEVHGLLFLLEGATDRLTEQLDPATATVFAA